MRALVASASPINFQDVKIETSRVAISGIDGNRKCGTKSETNCQTMASPVRAMTVS